MKKYLIPIFALSLLCGNVSAKVLSCDGCTPEQMFRVADEYLQGPGPVEPAYVNNLHNLTVRKYGYYNNWTPDFDPETDGLISWSEEMPVEPEIVQFVQNMPLQGFAFAKDYKMGEAGPYSSAWDILNTPTRETDVMIWAQSQWIYYDSRIVDYLRSVNPFPWYTPSNVSLVAQINFPDGTYFFIKLNTETKQFERFGPMKDQKNNPIPESKADFAGGDGTKDAKRKYIYDPEGQNDLDNFLHEADSYHIPIGGAQGSGGQTLIACTRVDGATTCYIIPQ
jgi:hypothetical protein